MRESFVNALDSELRQQAEGIAELDLRLADLHRRAAAQWPELALAPERFAAHLGRQVAGWGGDLESFLDQVLAEELYLALACIEGQASAHEIFDATFRPVLAQVAGRLNLNLLPEDELRQEIWTLVLVGTERAPASLTTYSGRAPLRYWLQALAYRAGMRRLSRKRRDPERPGAEPMEEILARAVVETERHDPETRYLKQHYQAEFKAALGEALRSLDARQRSVLQLAIVDHLSIDEIGRMYGVHRTSAARWQREARALVNKRVRRLLRERLAVQPRDVDSILNLVESQLELSMSRMFAEADSSEE